MSKPLYQLKAEFFKTLAHPARIRITLVWERDARSQQSFRRQVWHRLTNDSEALGHQSSTGEQHDRHRHLGDYQRTLQPLTTAQAAPRLLL